MPSEIENRIQKSQQIENIDQNEVKTESILQKQEDDMFVIWSWDKSRSLEFVEQPQR